MADQRFGRLIGPASLETVYPVKFGNDGLFKRQSWRCQKCFMDDLRAIFLVPVETGTHHVVLEQEGVCRHQMAARCEGIAQFAKNSWKPFLPANIIKNLGTQDQCPV